MDQEQSEMAENPCRATECDSSLQSIQDSVDQKVGSGMKRGRLKNGLPGADPILMRQSPRCGARAKSTGKPCQREGMRRRDGSYGRCYVHGGSSTGPRTEAGKERHRIAVTKHGRKSRAFIEQRRQLSAELKRLQSAAEQLPKG